jgi:hypothetical protein
MPNTGDETPQYAILSHTWEAEEVTFKDLLDGTSKYKAGYRKLQFCGEQVFWVDTCCIDKSSSAELAEAITRCSGGTAGRLNATFISQTFRCLAMMSGSYHGSWIFGKVDGSLATGHYKSLSLHSSSLAMASDSGIEQVSYNRSSR